jgi:amino-acid N-acetyltransferase
LRLGFHLVDRWSISPKVWQACIYCPKFHHCDEVAVLMNLVEQPAAIAAAQRPAGWTSLLRWDEWQPLKLAYQQKPGSEAN